MLKIFLKSKVFDISKFESEVLSRLSMKRLCNDCNDRINPNIEIGSFLTIDVQHLCSDICLSDIPREIKINAKSFILSGLVARILENDCFTYIAYIRTVNDSWSYRKSSDKKPKNVTTTKVNVAVIVYVKIQ